MHHVPLHLVVNLESLVASYVADNHGITAFFTVSRSVLTKSVQDVVNTVRVNAFLSYSNLVNALS